MKLSYSLFAALALPTLATVPNPPQGICIAGDSITQGGWGGGGAPASYRYSLFKNFVDNGIVYNPVGSMNTGTAGTNPYGGVTYNNANEGHSGWYSYQLNGAGGPKQGGGSIAPTPNNSNIMQWTGQSGSYANPYNPETLFIMVGTNDILHFPSSAPTARQVANNIKLCVEQYRQANPNLKAYVGGILPQDRTGYNSWNPTAYNNLTAEVNSILKQEASGWGATYVDTNAGFRNSDNSAVVANNSAGKTLTQDNLHPNAQGELILAGNIARAMGIGQRTAGLERKGSAQYASRATVNADKSVTVTTRTAEGTISAGVFSTVGANLISVQNLGNGKGNALVFNSAGTNTNIQYNWANTYGNQYTLSLDIKMSNANANNIFNIWFGAGNQTGGTGFGDGFLAIHGNQILWGHKGNNIQVLYATDMSLDFRKLTIAYRNGDVASGYQQGYYVWLGDQLIGEALQTGQPTGNSTMNRLQLGMYSDLANTSCQATVGNISFDLTGAYAPASIPESSTATLSLAAIGLLALRRRRKA